MKNILFLFSENCLKYKKANPYTLIDLMNEAGEASGVHYDYAFYERLMHVIGPDEAYILDTDSGKRLDDYNFVYHRRWGDAPEQAVACSIFLRKKGVAFADTEAYRPGSMDKLTQHWRLWENNLPVPHTVFVSSSRAVDWAANELADTFTFPVVIKSVNGTRGADNYLVESVEEAVGIIKGNPKKAFLIQEFIPNDGDYRVIVTGDTIPLLIYRQAAVGSHKNNTSLGGSATLADPRELSEPVRQACLKAAAAFKRDIAGVDLVFDKRDPSRFYFFEVNRSPQIEAASFSREKALALQEYFLTHLAMEEEE